MTVLPPPLASMLRQMAVYWPPATARWDSFGQPILSAPMEMKCRWEDRAEEMVDAEGTTFISKSLIYLEGDVEVGGFLMLGDLSDVVDPVRPNQNEGAWEIKRFDRLPTIRANKMLRTAYL